MDVVGHDRRVFTSERRAIRNHPVREHLAISVCASRIAYQYMEYPWDIKKSILQGTALVRATSISWTQARYLHGSLSGERFDGKFPVTARLWSFGHNAIVACCRVSLASVMIPSRWTQRK